MGCLPQAGEAETQLGIERVAATRSKLFLAMPRHAGYYRNGVRLLAIGIANVCFIVIACDRLPSAPTTEPPQSSKARFPPEPSGISQLPDQTDRVDIACFLRPLRREGTMHALTQNSRH